MTVPSPASRRFSHHAGLRLEPAFAASTTRAWPWRRYRTGVRRIRPDLRPTVSSSMTGAPANHRGSRRPPLILYSRACTRLIARCVRGHRVAIRLERRASRFWSNLIAPANGRRSRLEDLVDPVVDVIGGKDVEGDADRLAQPRVALVRGLEVRRRPDVRLGERQHLARGESCKPIRRDLDDAASLVVDQAVVLCPQRRPRVDSPHRVAANLQPVAAARQDLAAQPRAVDSSSGRDERHACAERRRNRLCRLEADVHVEEVLDRELCNERELLHMAFGRHGLPRLHQPLTATETVDARDPPFAVIDDWSWTRSMKVSLRATSPSGEPLTTSIQSNRPSPDTRTQSTHKRTAPYRPGSA